MLISGLIIVAVIIAEYLILRHNPKYLNMSDVIIVDFIADWQKVKAAAIADLKKVESKI